MLHVFTCTLDKLLDFKNPENSLCLWEEMGLVWPGWLRNSHGGNISKRFKHYTCYERRKVYGMLACVSYDMHVRMAANMPW